MLCRVWVWRLLVGGCLGVVDLLVLVVGLVWFWVFEVFPGYYGLMWVGIIQFCRFWCSAGFVGSGGLGCYGLLVYGRDLGIWCGLLGWV